MTTPLTITKYVSDGCTVIIAVGELDLASYERLEVSFAAVVKSARPLVADLSRIAFMDSTGLKTLVRADMATNARGNRMVIVPSPAVARVLELSQINRIVTLRSNLEDALAAAHQHTAG